MHVFYDISEKNRESLSTQLSFFDVDDDGNVRKMKR